MFHIPNFKYTKTFLVISDEIGHKWIVNVAFIDWRELKFPMCSCEMQCIKQLTPKMCIVHMKNYAAANLLYIMQNHGANRNN